MPKRIAFQTVVPRLRTFLQDHKRLPTFSEFQRLFHYRSKGGVSWLVSQLIKQDILTRDTRGRLISTPRLEGAIKLLGTIQAGFPSPAEEELLDTVSLDEWLIQRPEATYLVRIQGDSMRDAGILPGDLVLVERGRIPKPGDIVVAHVDGEWTVKRYELVRGKIVLQPANPAYPPIQKYRSLAIEGVVIANVRRYR